MSKELQESANKLRQQLEELANEYLIAIDCLNFEDQVVPVETDLSKKCQNVLRRLNQNEIVHTKSF
jgi:hypothetical protein